MASDLAHELQVPMVITLMFVHIVFGLLMVITLMLVLSVGWVRAWPVPPRAPGASALLAVLASASECRFGVRGGHE